MLTACTDILTRWRRPLTQQTTINLGKWRDFFLAVAPFALTLLAGYVGHQIQFAAHAAVVDEEIAQIRKEVVDKSTEQTDRSNKIETKVDLLSQQQLTTYGAVKEISGEMKTLTRQLTLEPGKP